MNRLTSILVLIVIVVGPQLGIAQTPPAPDEPPAKAKRDVRPVRDGVQRLYDEYRGDRLQEGWSSVISGVLSGGLGAYFLIVALENDTDPNAPAFALLGTGVIGLGIGELARGMWNLLSPHATEDIAAKLLNDRQLLETSGMLFLEQEARRARRARLLKGTLQMANGVTTGLLIIPFRHFSNEDSADVITIVLGAVAVFSIGSGVVSLFGESLPEDVYHDTRRKMGMQPGEVRMTPTLIPDSAGRVHYGAGLGWTW